MKGIAKDQESITKDYESLFYSMKDQYTKKVHITSQVIYSNSPVLVGSLLHL